MLSFFESGTSTGARRFDRFLVAVLFMVGLITWAYFLGFGAVALDFHDWADITIPRLTFMQSALRSHDLPLHLARSNALHGVTERFLAIPDVITTPQSLLLLAMPVGRFVVVDALIHYTLGFVGLLLLRRYFAWSLFTFTCVFLLILFNGHVLAHYSVGHFTWGPYFLFPVVALWVMRALDGHDGWQDIASLAAAMFYMVLAGGEHHLTWILILLVALAPFCWPRVGWILAVIVSVILLSAVRLLPPALELGAFRQAGFITDVHGYPSLMHLFEALVYLRREAALTTNGVPANIVLFDQRYWEYNVYVGVVGAGMIAYGVWGWLRAERVRYWQLIVPLFIITMLSIGSVYRLPRITGLPLLLGERATSRMFSLVLVFLVILSANVIDQRVRALARGSMHRTLALIALLFLAIDIAAGVRLQRVGISSGMFGPSPFNPSTAAHYADPVYTAVLVTGLAITVATALTLAVLVWRERGARPLAVAHDN